MFPVEFIYFQFFSIFAIQCRKTSFEGLWAIYLCHSQKVQVQTLYSYSHIGGYVIVSVICSD